jgi:RNA polymerase sigma-54 factor
MPIRHILCLPIAASAEHCPFRLPAFSIFTTFACKSADMDSQRQRLKLAQQQHLSPQQLQIIGLIGTPMLALEQQVKRELELNPTLEEGPDPNSPTLQDADSTDTSLDAPSTPTDDTDDDDAISGVAYNGSAPSDNYDPGQRFRAPTSFRDSLLEQLALRRITPDIRELAEYIIGNLDADGYLRRELPTLADDLLIRYGRDVKAADLEAALGQVQSLDPAGIGAHTLQECLQLQLRDQQGQAATDALAILSRAFEAFAAKQYARVAEKLKLPEDRLQAATDLIRQLNPRPGNLWEVDAATQGQTIVPDFTVWVDPSSQQPVVRLNGRNTPALHISPTYQAMLKDFTPQNGQKSPASHEASQFIRQKIDSAHQFIEALHQRNATLMAVMQAIASHQRDYLSSGDIQHLKPLILKDIAQEMGLDISTISRAVNHRYAQTPHGIIPLRDFFSESAPTAHGVATTRAIKEAIQQAIDHEDRSAPLTDDALLTLLQQQGYALARRTVAKYREMLGIPVARLRKEI